MANLICTIEGKNTIEIYSDGHAEIILANGQRAMIDAEDIDKCKEHRWHIHVNRDKVYARCNEAPNFLHRLVLNINESYTVRVRHIDGNGLNCRKSNLTLTTKEEPEPTPVDVTKKPLPHTVIIYKNKGYAELVLINNKNNEEVRVKIDLDDVDKVKDLRWSYNSAAIQNSKAGCLHRYIMNAPKDINVLFKNEDKLDCRKSNLLCLTNRETHYYYESKKQQEQSNNKSVIVNIEPKPIVNIKNPKGVADIGNGFFFVSVYNEKTDTLDQVGTFSNKEEAYLAYEKRVREICEELAKDAYESLVASLMEQYYE